MASELLFLSENDGVAVPILTLAAILLSLLFWFKFVSSSMCSKKSAPLPPGPWGVPILGYLPFLNRTIHHTFAELAKSYGPIFRVRLGGKRCMVVSSATLAKQVLRDLDTTFANRDAPHAAMISTYGGQDVAFGPYSANWRRLRKVMAREMMSSASMNSSYALRQHEVRRTIRDVYASIGKTIHVGSIARSTVISVTLRSIWGGTLRGEQAERMGEEFRTAILDMLKLMSKPNLSDVFPVLGWFDFQGVEKEAKKVLKRAEQIMDPIIEAGKKLREGATKLDLEGKIDFVQVLLELKESLTPREIKALIVDVVGGSTDTTSATVEWAMSNLIQFPHIMAKVQEELAQVVGMDNIVEEAHLPKLQYLNAVVKETLRLYPTGPLLLPRRPSESCTVGGYTVPKGTTLFINAWALQRDSEVWDNATEYRPERFLGESSKFDYNGNTFNYLPFGSGRRMCPGIPFADKMLLYILGSLLHSFDWKSPEGERLDFSDNLGIVTKKKIPLVAIPMQRLSDSKHYE